MKKLVITAVLFALCVVAPLFAQLPSCPGLNPTVTGKTSSPAEYTINWTPVPGTVFYSIEETLDNVSPIRTTISNGTNGRTSFSFSHESTTNVPYRYRIVAFSNTGGCEMLARVTVVGDAELRRAVRRGIIPIVGSARGANGSEFKTFLRLEGAGLHGRLIFHPANHVASDNDPSIPYDTSMKNEWDDIVAAMGQSGIGSLSVVPAEGEVAQIPRATVRLYNVASNGIYGANTELYPAVNFLDSHTPFQRIDVPADGNFRVNVGARAVLAGTARAVAITAEGLEKATAERTLAAGEVLFGSPEAIYGISLAPGESLVVTFSRAIVPFYTLTDNRTNDPFLYVQGAERNDVVEQYIK